MNFMDAKSYSSFRSKCISSFNFIGKGLSKIAIFAVFHDNEELLLFGFVEVIDVLDNVVMMNEFLKCVNF